MRFECKKCRQGFLLEPDSFYRSDKCRSCRTGVLKIIEAYAGEPGYVGKKDSGKQSTKTAITGWNPREKTFYEYCGPDSYANDKEILAKVPAPDRAHRNLIDKIKHTDYDRPKE